MKKEFFVTTPIYYVNARPHLGHAYTTVIADVAARFHRMKNQDVYFLTGTDEHGDKVVKAAIKENIGIKTYVDNVSSMFQNLWPELNVQYSQFIRTTDPKHIAVVERILQKIYDAGDIYYSEYEGLYCFGCERFYSPRELDSGKCPDHKTSPELIQEGNYFFRMSKYQNQLIEHINNNPDFIRPERYRNEVLSFLKEPLEDLCISRPKTRLKWGISLPFDNDYVTYVWFDALINYVSALGDESGELFKKFWPVAQHIVAKDILKPHGIYWPTILLAAGIPLYKNLNVHGYWNVDQSKMSKTLGNVVEPLQMKNIYGTDAFRYFLMRDMAFGLDADFSEDALIQRINSDLANDLGNLFSRSVTMAHKYFNGVIPDNQEPFESDMMNLKSDALSIVNAYESEMQTYSFHKALAHVWEFINLLNKYIDRTAPWELSKHKQSQKILETVIYNILEGLRIVAGLIYPVMPHTSITMLSHLGIEVTEPSFETLKEWGVLKSKTQIKKTVTLFPRIEQSVKEQTETKDELKQELGIKPEISYETFSQIDLRVGTILEAEPVPKSKKLLKLTVDTGKVRTVIAGIANIYDPKDLIGKQVAVVVNLKPAKLMGVISEGMVLAGISDDIGGVLTLDKHAQNGMQIK